MSQNLIVKTIPSQLRLRFNIPNVDELFSLGIGDFAVLHGSRSISYLTSLLCVRSQLPPQMGGLASNVVFIDGANTFRLYEISRMAQVHRLDPNKVLDNITLARAFTAYQMMTLTMQGLKEQLDKTGAKVAIISDIARTFLDTDIPDQEAYSIYSHLLRYLSKFAQTNNVVLIATYLSHQDTQRNRCLEKLTCGKANVVASLRGNGADRRFLLEKHPTSILGYALMPSSADAPRITEFMEESWLLI